MLLYCFNSLSKKNIIAVYYYSILPHDHYNFQEVNNEELIHASTNIHYYFHEVIRETLIHALTNGHFYNHETNKKALVLATKNRYYYNYETINLNK